ncbi:cyclic nucleotide-gated ion channel 1 [Prunus persica]|nr:cyclic nucleotide-gated ion channel 1 [Prunus persica]
MANRKGEIHLDMENSEEKPATASVQRSISMGVVQHWKKKSDKWTKLRNNIVGHEQNHAQPNRFFPEWNTVFLVSCVLAVSLDPLFLYIPIINEDRKCLKYDKRLKAISFGLRLLADLFYMADVVYRILTRPKAKEAVPLKASNSVNSRTTLQFYILLDILAVLPVPQVALSIFLSKMRGSKSLKTMKFLNSLVLLQYVPRVLPIYLLCHEREKTHKKAGIWVKSFLNFFLYILASHVIGALWYIFAIQREIACWQYACQSENGCEPNTFRCDDSSVRNVTVLNELCPINPPNATLFNFGIFVDALQYSVLQSTNFPDRFLNCFWWGLRHLSSFGQNLQTSTYAWENLFAVFISIIGLLLFLYLIGNIQTYMQFSTTTSEKQRRNMKMKGLEVELWLSENRLPNTMKTRIMENVHRKLEENKNVHVEILFVLPPDYLSYVKRCLCLATLRKVPKLKDIDGLEELKGICDHFKPVIYAKDSFIIREGEALDMILLVTQGTVRSYTTSNGVKKDPTTPKHIKQGDFYGEELISWASKFPPSTELPISDKNVRSITRVEAFALTAEDLKNHVLLRYFWWQFTKGIDLNNLTDSQMLQLKELAVINPQRAFRGRKRAEKPAALPMKTRSMSVVPILSER